ncbi:crossover junction endonuclease MUS81 [Amborella trichopoda]|uniref:crossover junction endonuclease MUS81 n=1 Tax=Amborella trichopoda TaxID=13333 RepID=UPI0009BE3B26|nr:crossover junction endonuclease MUS81 [Amborella trichopoda]|eukprot:XP_020522223.1 crossover junction endonuclease MUS81 [Amborella trichopoda]
MSTILFFLFFSFFREKFRLPNSLKFCFLSFLCRGVGKWTLKLLQEFFNKDSEPLESDSDANATKKKGTRTKRYLPQKNSAPFALLITLYRESLNGRSSMKKQELIDATEASGLTHMPIGLPNSSGKGGGFGGLARDWYCGWNSMKTLLTKGLVVKSSCPAKYMLSQEGQETARECLQRSGLRDCDIPLAKKPDKSGANGEEMLVSDINKKLSKRKSVSASLELSEMMTSMEYSDKDAHLTSSEASQMVGDKDVSSLRTCTFGHHLKMRVDALLAEPTQKISIEIHDLSDASDSGDTGPVSLLSKRTQPRCSNESSLGTSGLRACTSSAVVGDAQGSCGNALAVPPCSPGEKFEDLYDVILLLDDREQFLHNNQGSLSRRVVESLCLQFKVQVEIRRLPVGDGIWIARHKCLQKEYVLDFIVERKKVEDLRTSIRDNRYRDQKLRLLRCGLQKLIYLIEGDPNSSEAAESIKTAAFTTEILEGFDVQRTSSVADTVKKYGHLTHAITHYYTTQSSHSFDKSERICPSYEEFIKTCQDLEKMTVSDVFALQLMQVPQVTEEVALAVLDMYPTVLSLARAYSEIEGDVRAQEDMLRNQSKAIGAGASRNIYKLVWRS